MRQQLRVHKGDLTGFLRGLNPVLTEIGGSESFWMKKILRQNMFLKGRKWLFSWVSRTISAQMQSDSAKPGKKV
jgi:hypothetical protein